MILSLGQVLVHQTVDSKMLSHRNYWQVPNLELPAEAKYLHIPGSVMVASPPWKSRPSQHTRPHGFFQAIALSFFTLRRSYPDIVFCTKHAVWHWEGWVSSPTLWFFSCHILLCSGQQIPLCVWKHICLRWSLMLPTVDYGAGSQPCADISPKSSGGSQMMNSAQSKSHCAYLSLGADLTLGFSILLFCLP